MGSSLTAALVAASAAIRRSLVADDATASFDERRFPAGAQRGHVPERGAREPSEKFCRVRPQGEHPRSRHRQKLLRADPAT